MIPDPANTNYFNKDLPEENSNHSLGNIIDGLSGRVSAVGSKLELLVKIEKFINEIKLTNKSEFECIFPFNPECNFIIKLGPNTKKDAPIEKETCIFYKKIENVGTGNHRGLVKVNLTHPDLNLEFDHAGIMKNDENKDSQIQELFEWTDEEMNHFKNNNPDLTYSDDMFTKSEIDEISKLLESKLPKNVKVDMKYMDGDYKLKEMGEQL